MSGDSEIPPTYYFSGIKFNPSFYQSSSSNYLTLATAKSSFLAYPTAQGSETISTLISSSIYSSTINSTSDASDFSIVPLQYDGILNIGTGARSLLGAINIGTGSTNVANPITIGSDMSAVNLYGTVSIKSGNLIVDSTSISCGSYLSPNATTLCTFASNVQSVPITLGQGMLSSSIDIANHISFNGNVTIANSATSGTNYIQLGNSRTTTTNGGTFTSTGSITANNGLTLASGKYIATSHTGTIAIPSLTTQVGYIQSVSYSAPTIPTSSQVITMNSITLSAGVWILTGAVSFNSTQLVTHGFLSFGDTSRPTSIAPVVNDSLYGNTSFNGVTINDKVTPNLTSYISPTASTTYYFNLCLTYSGAGVVYNNVFWRLYAIRIA